MKPTADLMSYDFDIIVIGAGINGAGIARDAALRGLKVLLLEKHDICSGTSAWSSRLIHGGLRYLEYGELALVRESLRERDLLLGNAPHLVRRIPMLVPIYKGARRGRLKIRAGMIAYDLLARNGPEDRYKMISSEDTQYRATAIATDGLLGAALFQDAQIEFAERLVVENALDARAHGAIVKTYAEVEEIVVDAATVKGVKYRTPAATLYSSARAVVNVAGPWVDQVLNGHGQKRLIGGAKGSHIVVPLFPGAPLNTLYVEAQRDGRPFFIMPWNDMLLIGTTDQRFDGDLDRLSADDDELDYLVCETNRVLPQAGLTKDAILYSYAGVRPLPFSEHESESGITRRHFVVDHAPAVAGLFSIVGGKLTTYRSLAQQALDQIVRTLNLSATGCTTRASKLPGAVELDQATRIAQAKYGGMVGMRVLERLLRIYGARALAMLEMVVQRPHLGQEFDEASGAIAAELVFAFESEMAQTLADALLRRTMVGLNRFVGLNTLEAASVYCADDLGWSRNRIREECDAYREYVTRFRARTSIDPA